LRAKPGSIGLTTGNGWYVTKHSASVWSTAPPRAALGAPIEAPTAVGPAPLGVRDDAAGAAVLDAWTVVYARDGAPSRGVVIGQLADGARFVANTPSERGLLEDFVRAERVGCRGHVRADGERLRFEPS
jgi:hypothetical protein